MIHTTEEEKDMIIADLKTLEEEATEAAACTSYEHKTSILCRPVIASLRREQSRPYAVLEQSRRQRQSKLYLNIKCFKILLENNF